MSIKTQNHQNPNPAPRSRFAPSPTGSLHLGGARTALYNYLFAKNNSPEGEFILRCEDTDLQRSTEESLATQIQDLNWLELNWDEGPDPKTLKDNGPHGPYRQSQRTDLYQTYINKLIELDLAYYCFLTDEEALAQKEAAKAAHQAYQVTSPYRNMPIHEAREKIKNGEKATVRFKIPEQDIDYTFTDLVRGEVTLPSHMVGDFVLMRTNGMPVYNFCCVIDDNAMKITHVLRGEEHLSNTLRQLMLYKALKYTPPQFGHLSMILGENRKKLSKRDSAVSCDDFKQKGFLPQALLNYIALLGWSSESGEEIFELKDLIKEFSIDRVHSAAAIFDVKKLTWINQQHIRKLTPEHLWEQLKPFLDQAGLNLNQDPSWVKQSLELFTPNLETLTDAIALYTPLADNKFAITEQAAEVLTWTTSKQVISTWISEIKKINSNYLTTEQFSKLLNQIKSDCAVKGKELFMPIRVAVIGAPQGAELKALIPLLKTKTLLQRAEMCLSHK